MFPIRRAALRALRTSAPLSAVAQCHTRSFATALSASSRPAASLSARLQSPVYAHRSALVSLRRSYATEESAEKSSLEDAKDKAAEAIDAIEHAEETAAQAADRASDAAASVAGAVSSSQSLAGIKRPEFERQPNNTVYCGNLYFEISEDTLRQKFEAIAPVKSVKIIYDGRGLSKGFGYVEFEDVDSATRAIEQFDSETLEGRRLFVQYATATRAQARKGRYSTTNTPVNPPSKTLFVGNMSFEMTDKDLNDLFREVKNVLDVRVAIDRRTGQPRGFAHADFIDVKSAEAAAEYLRTKEYYGRPLRVDFSTPSGTTRAAPQ